MKKQIKKTNKLNIKVLTLCVVLGGAIQGYSQPTTGGPTPTPPQSHVISVWNSSSTYTNIAVPGGYFNNWYNPGYAGGAGLYDVSGGGGVNVLYYPAPVTIWGIDFTANPYNVSGCTNLHIDVWSPTATTYDIRLVNTVGGTQQADATGVIVTSGWNSLDIPLSVFTTANHSLSLNAIDQIGIVGDASANSTYYIDNIYFSAGTNLVYTPPPAPPAPTNNAPTPIQPAGNVLALYNSSGTYSDWPAFEFPANWSGSPQTSFTITNTGSVVQYLPGLSFVGDTYYPNPINTTPFNTMHIDLWTGKGNQFYMQLVSVVPNTQAAQVGVFNMPTNQWVGIDIPISQFAAANPNTDLTDIQQVLWVDNTGTGLQGADFYFDNVYFYSNAVVAPPTATTVYVDPTQTWIGYMNWQPAPNTPSGGGGSGSSAWGTSALPAVFTGSKLTLSPNVNVYDNTSDSYWVNPDGSGANTMDANFYVENDSLAGQTVTFTGYCGGNTLVSPYTSTAFIKDFSPSYSLNGSVAVPFTNGQPFSISLATTPGDHIQYGFETVGPDANPATVSSLGTVLIGSNATVFAGPITNGIKASIASGTLVGWSASSANSYLAQKSSDNSVWTSVGPILFGNAVTSQFDLGKAPFYRVLEETPGGANVVPNPSFEIAASPANAIGATNWNIAVLPNTGATMLVTNQFGSVQPYAGANMLLIQSTTAASGSVAPPNTDVRSDLFPVTAGQTYNVSFYAANLAKVGGANPQYDFFFYNAANGAVGGPTFTSFSSVGSSWTQVTTTVTPPAGATQMTIGWIQAAGAGNGENWVTLIDNVVVTTGAISGPTNTLSATTQPGVQISWSTATGTNYQVQSSANLQATPAWSTYGAQISGNGATNSVTDTVSGTQKYYRVLGIH